MLIMSVCVSVLWVPKAVTDIDTIGGRIERFFDASTVQEALEVIKESANDASVRIESSYVDGADTIHTSVEVLKIDYSGNSQ